MKENALDIDYSVEGVVCQSFGDTPSEKDDSNTFQIQKLVRAAIDQGASISVLFTATEQRRQVTDGSKVGQSTQNIQTSASNNIERENGENKRATKETINYPKV